MRFSILGPLEVLDDAGRDVLVTRPLHRSALCFLLLHAGQPCSAASLTAGLWGDQPPLSPEVSLRSCVYGIRKLLPDAARLRTHQAGYLIAVRPGELDLHEFTDLAVRGRAALDDGDPAAAAVLLGRAVRLWREPPLADVPAVRAGERLLDQRMQAREALADARLALGEHRQLLAELRGSVTAEPLREHAWAQLIVALYRCGARAEALAAFGRLRMTLISAYGIDPGPELQELHARVLADDPALLVTAAGRAPAAGGGQPAARAGAGGINGTAGAAGRARLAGLAGTPAGLLASPSPACQLPAAPADFTGRADELGELLARLSGEGMAVTVVTGMLGTGKTALAVHAAHLARAVFPGGQLYACLDDAGRPRDPQVVLGELLRGLGMPAGAIPAARFEREALYRSVLAGRRVLVLADGAVSAAQVRPLLPGTAGSAVVVTSRARLPDLYGARFIEVGGLRPADSVRLLGAISGRDLPGPGEPGATKAALADAEAACSIAAACGHLPLALRIAGARLADDPELTLTWLAALLADERRRLDELAVGQASIRTTVVAAARGVSGQARRALALLAAGPLESPGPVIATLPGGTAAAKVGPELADAGLLCRVSADGRFGGRGYRLHPLVRACAGELLALGGTQPGLAPAPPGQGPGGTSSRLITTRVGDRRTTSVNPARS